MDSSGGEDSTYEDFSLSYNSSYTQKCDLSMSDQLADFQRLRISALTKAAEMSPYVKEATIGPNSPVKKEPVKEPEPVKEEEEVLEATLMEDKISEDLRYTLLMKEYEAKVQEATESIFKNMLEKMVEDRVEIIQNCRQRQVEENKKRIKEMKKLQLRKEVFTNDNLLILETAKIDQQRSQILINQRIENVNKILEEQNKAMARFAAVTDSHTKICICYNQITQIFSTETLKTNVYNKFVTGINNVIITITAVMNKCSTHPTTEKEVKQAEVLAANIESIKEKILEEVNSAKQEKVDKTLKQEQMMKQKVEEKQAAEQQVAALHAAHQVAAEQQVAALHTAHQVAAEQQVAALHAAHQVAAEQQVAEHNTAAQNTVEQLTANQQTVTQARSQTVSQAATTSIPMFYSTKNYSYYTELKNFLEQYESQYKGLLENTNLKKFRFDCQKAVNTPVNAISSVSMLHMKDKYEKLAKLLKGERVEVLDTYISATQHPQGLAYCTALLAKKIVKQGDLLVSSNPEAAFPLAAITVALWSQFPEFGKLLEAYFHKLCPYLVPMFLPQQQGQTDKEFYLSRGYTYNDEGVVEKQDKFLKRMSGIFRLRCAIWIAKTPKFLKATNPHNLQYGWQWLASFVNLRPEPDICATLLYDFFTVCGSEFLRHYGKQFTKLIKLISKDYLAILQNIDEGGPKTRLEVFLQNVLTTGHIQPPNGLLEPNAW